MNEVYQHLYQVLQTRMGPNGNLSPGSRNATYTVHTTNNEWTRERRQLHRAVLEEFKAKYGDRPRDGRAVLLTAGAPGAGKGSAQANLAEWQQENSELGRALADAHGVDLKHYVPLDPDEFKVSIFEHGGLPTLDAELMALPYGRELSPSEMASLIHEESAYLQDNFEVWARSQGYNLLYDATLKNLDKNTLLLGDLGSVGYEQRVILSVEVPLEQCLAQNADRWMNGRIKHEEGDPDYAYGGRMAPEGMIKNLYAQSSTGRGHSIGRENAEKLADKGLATALITTDRGTFPTQATAPTQAAVFQQGDTRVSIAAAGRLRSTQATATQATATRTTPPAQTTAPTLPRQTPPAPGRTR
ncbi:zeta toxin family protein [Streptomyces sp. NBC_00249]|uniref:zeta toxin family protein n=1 Tax=Streptomyces sp. NBC_00249 TaxID=2975690 RepID=UPI002258C1D5|nr:zeta toxin family protein [Streptomyces sp. NBC_00249]MCX5195015.1 zeta toxin family protein [Streptomyces sp. NBC_00249]